MPALAAFLAFGLAACAHPPPEQQLRQQVARLQAAVPARDLAPIRQTLAPDFIGPDGMDRDTAIRVAQLQYIRNARIDAVFGPSRIALLPSAAAPDHATVDFTVALAGGAASALPDAARVYQVRTGWRLQDGEWRLTSAGWTPAL